MGAFQMSERHACRLIGLARSSMRYRARPDRNGPLRARLGELAAHRPRFGYRRLQALLERDGLHANHKRIVVDNGPEFRSRAMEAWSEQQHVSLRFIDAGKPVQNAFVESFNGRPSR